MSIFNYITEKEVSVNPHRFDLKESVTLCSENYIIRRKAKNKPEKDDYTKQTPGKTSHSKTN